MAAMGHISNWLLVKVDMREGTMNTFSFAVPSRCDLIWSLQILVLLVLVLLVRLIPQLVLLVIFLISPTRPRYLLKLLVARSARSVCSVNDAGIIDAVILGCAVAIITDTPVVHPQERRGAACAARIPGPVGCPACYGGCR